MDGKRMRRLGGNAGYTALEALTAIGVMGLMVGFAAPSMKRLKATQELESATSQVGGMLQQVRARAQAESTPYLVLIQDEEVVDGERSVFALIVRDNDRSYSLTDVDNVENFSLDPTLRPEIRQYGDAEGDTLIADVSVATSDYTRTDNSGPGSTSSGSGSGSSGSGSGETLMISSTETLVETSFSSSSETLDATSVNGSTFPVSSEMDVPAIAFNERGIPVSPDSPTEWGSGAGAIYLTDNETTVYAAVISPLGEVSTQRLDVSTGTWK